MSDIRPDSTDAEETPNKTFSLTLYQLYSLVEHLRNRDSQLTDEGNTTRIAGDIEDQVPELPSDTEITEDADEEVEVTLSAYQIGWMQETLITGSHWRDRDDPGHKSEIHEQVARQTDIPPRHWDDEVYEAAHELGVYTTEELASELGYDDTRAQVNEFDVVDSNVGMIEAGVVERHGTRDVDGIDTAQWKFVGSGDPDEDEPDY